MTRVCRFVLILGCVGCFCVLGSNRAFAVDEKYDYESISSNASSDTNNDLEAIRKSFQKYLDDGQFMISSKRNSESSVTLKWDCYNKHLHYEIYKSVKKRNKYSAYRYIKKTTKNSCAIKKLKSNRMYRFKVYVYADVGEGKYLLKKSVPFSIKTANGSGMNVEKVVLQNTNVVLYKRHLYRIRFGVKLKNNGKCYKQPKMTYYSSDKSIVKVDKKGLVSARNKGKAIVYVIAPSGAYDKIHIKIK